MSYFVLHAHCYMQEGSEKSAVYDIFQSRIFWIEEEWKQKFLQYSRKGCSMEEAAAKTGVAAETAAQYSRFLQQLDLGLIFSTKRASAKFKPFNTKFQAKKNGFFRPLAMVTLETSSKCAKNCEGCAALKSMECACGIYSDTSGVTYDIDNAIRLLCYTGIQLIMIAGGEPYDNRQDLEKIIASAHSRGIPVMVKTPFLRITETDIKYLKDHGAFLSLTLHDLTDSDDCDTHELSRFQDILSICAKAGYTNVNVTLCLRSKYVRHLQDTLNLINSIHVKVNSVSVEYAADICSLGAEEIQKAVSQAFPFSHVRYAADMEKVTRNLTGHPCWADGLCIMASGEVKPCIASGDLSFGNLHNKHLLEIIHDRPDSIILDNGKMCEPCSGCEFSLGCFSCSVANGKVTGNRNGKAWDCTYNL